MKSLFVSIITLFVLISSQLHAQSLADAQSAINAEQFQKAKFILNKAVLAGNAAEDCFYLGWVYLRQDAPDSAKIAFDKGIALNPKFALNYVGLGTLAKIDQDVSSAQINFDKALSLSGKNDRAYIYIAKADLMKPKPDADAALAILDKAIAIGTKDPAYFMELGNAYRGKGDNNHAYMNYAQAQILDPKSTEALIDIADLWKQAHNFEDGTQKLKDALVIDQNYGPAYRELAETDLLWAKTEPKMASVKIKEGADYYKKYIELTDRSPESEMRYADFLIQAGDYQTLEQVAKNLAQSSKSNLRVYRYLGYADYENKNYQAGLDALNTFLQKAEAKRVIPRDYLYLGRLQLKTNQDSLGILNLKKAIILDSTYDEAYADIAKSYYTRQKYVQAGDAYREFITQSHQAKLGDYFREGMSYYFAYSDQYYKSSGNVASAKPDSALLTKADSAFSYVAQKTSAKPYPDAYLFRARIKDLEETNRNDIQGFAKPYYEKYVALETVNPPADDRTKKNLAEAYAYLGAYYEFKEKDDAKAAENFGKARDTYADNKQAKDYFARKETAATKSK